MNQCNAVTTWLEILRQGQIHMKISQIITRISKAKMNWHRSLLNFTCNTRILHNLHLLIFKCLGTYQTQFAPNPHQAPNPSKKKYQNPQNEHNNKRICGNWQICYLNLVTVFVHHLIMLDLKFNSELSKRTPKAV